MRGERGHTAALKRAGEGLEMSVSLTYGTPSTSVKGKPMLSAKLAFFCYLILAAESVMFLMYLVSCKCQLAPSVSVLWNFTHLIFIFSLSFKLSKSPWESLSFFFISDLYEMNTEDEIKQIIYIYITFPSPEASLDHKSEIYHFSNNVSSKYVMKKWWELLTEMVFIDNETVLQCSPLYYHEIMSMVRGYWSI